jgi:YD repeat-containing protein
MHRLLRWLPLPSSLLLLAWPCAAQGTCGNGRVDPGESCDPTVHWADHCPAPWGLCWTCAPACNGRVLSSGDGFIGLDVVPFCTEQTPGAHNQHRYDAHGHLTAYDHYGTVHWTFAYDAQGRMTEQHMRVDPHPAEHLFRAWTDDRITRAWLDRDLDGTPDRTWFFAYTPEHLLDRVWSSPDTPGGLPGSDRRYTYDRHGRVVVDEMRFGDAAWHNTDTFAFDARGREVYTRHVGEPRNCDNECRTRWDPQGSTRRCVVGAPDGTTPVTRTSRRDVHGHLLWQVAHEANGARLERHFVLAHDRLGNVVSEVELDPRGAVVGRTRRRYDAATGLPAREVWASARQVNYDRDFRCLAPLLPQVPWRASSPGR